MYCCFNLSETVLFYAGTHILGPFKGDSHENQDFERGQRLVWPLKWSRVTARDHFGAKKVEAPNKSRDFHGKPLEMAQVFEFPPKKYCQAQVKAEIHW